MGSRGASWLLVVNVVNVLSLMGLCWPPWLTFWHKVSGRESLHPFLEPPLLGN